MRRVVVVLIDGFGYEGSRSCFVCEVVAPHFFCPESFIRLSALWVAFCPAE